MNPSLLTRAFATTAFAVSALQAQAPATASTMPQDPASDPFLWLEDVGGDKALQWVRAQNATSQEVLTTHPRFEPIRTRLLSILDSTARIPYVQKHGEHYYNLWQDAQNPRGLWRRTSLEEYRKDTPKWDVVLDLDALGKAENENWVWKSSSWLVPDRTRVLLSLSRGGADAAVVREFDVATKQFVADGFVLTEAKSSVAWRDRDSIYVGTDFGEGSLTSSGYPRIVKLWKRGTPLSSETTVAEGKSEDVFVYGYRDQTVGFERDFVYRGVTFYTNELFLLRDGKSLRIDKPDSANASVHQDWLMIELRDDWQVGDTT
ncbi:MAG: S9 family peptidase, partial [Planctomycetota bacterium]